MLNCRLTINIGGSNKENMSETLDVYGAGNSRSCSMNSNPVLDVAERYVQ